MAAASDSDSQMTVTIRILRFGPEDKHGALLRELARSQRRLERVNELSLKVVERERGILSSYYFNRFTRGAGGRD
jgi:hypothetical protein